MSGQRWLTAACVTLGVLAVLAAVATLTLGYLAIFTDPPMGEDLGNAALLTATVTFLLGLGVALCSVGLDTE